MRTCRSRPAMEFGGSPVRQPGRGPARRLVAGLPAVEEDRTEAGLSDKYGDRYVAVDG